MFSNYYTAEPPMDPPLFAKVTNVSPDGAGNGNRVITIEIKTKDRIPNFMKSLPMSSGERQLVLENYDDLDEFNPNAHFDIRV